MSSLFRDRRSYGAGSGGKIVRGRRTAPSASPYLRPEKPPSPPPDGQSGSSTWISGLMSGVGRLISSVFRSESPSPSSSYSYSSDEDISPSSDEDDDTDVSSKEPDELKQIENKSEPAKDCIGRSLAIISEIESKHAIEQLLMQETFSRDECSKLTKIIQSRVVDFPSAHDERLDTTTGNAIAFPGTWQSLNRARKLPETISYSSSSLNAISPGSSACQALTPDLRNSAVMETKKWLENKKLASTSKVDFNRRPCTLNTNMLQYDFEGEVGSPVDMAKSYMRTLSPWKSPPLSSTSFEKTPCIGVHLYKDEAPCATAIYSPPSSKVLKRNYLAFGSRVTLDEIRRVRLKSTENDSDSSKCKQIDSSTRYLECEAYKISSAADECTFHDSRNLPESIDASTKLSAELCFKDYCSVGTLRLPDEKAVEANKPLTIGNTTSLNLTSDTEEAVNAVQFTHETSSLTALPLRPNSGIGSGPQLCDPAILIGDENKDVEEPSQIKEKLGSVSVPCDSLILAPTSAEHDGDHLVDLLNSETKMMSSIDITSAPCDVDAVTGLSNVYTSSIQMSSGSEMNSLHQKLASGVKEIHSIADLKSHDGDGQTHNKVNGLTNNFFANGLTEGLNTNPHVGSKEEPNSTDSSNGEPAAGISGGNRELSHEATDNVLVLKTNSLRARSHGGTIMKPVKEVLTEPQPSTSRGRGRRAVPRPRRGRGK